MTSRISITLLVLTFSVAVFANRQTSKLRSDGPDTGLSAYELIQTFGGKRPIESPDLYPENHPEVPHIIEDTDELVGHHFVFILHRDIDKDRDKYEKFSDRQRNEIKAYDGSKPSLKAYKGESMRYRWKFKVEDNMSLSKNFSHFFQLKSVDDGVGMPILTISGRVRKGKRLMELRHAAVDRSTPIETLDWKEVSNVWLEVEVEVNYADEGSLEITITRLDNNEVIVEHSSEAIDMWRGTKQDHFVRPKWGYYRSLKSKEMLKNEEDRIRFADFEVTKLN